MGAGGGRGGGDRKGEPFSDKLIEATVASLSPSPFLRGGGVVSAKLWSMKNIVQVPRHQLLLIAVGGSGGG